jgi:hypothetical protein
MQQGVVVRAALAIGLRTQPVTRSGDDNRLPLDLNECMGAVNGFEHLSLVRTQAATPGESRTLTVAELEAEYRAEIRALSRRARLRVVHTAARNVRQLSLADSRHSVRPPA